MDVLKTHPNLLGSDKPLQNTEWSCSSKLPDLGAGNWNQVLWKSSKLP